MNRTSRRYTLLLGGSLLFFGGMSYGAAKTPPATPQQTAPDNTKMNKGDGQKGAVTADQQAMSPADRDISKKIRASIMDDKSLSTYAHNVKLITQDGKVTLKGPVRTEKEKAAIESTAAEVAGSTNVNSEITIAPLEVLNLDYVYSIRQKTEKADEWKTAVFGIYASQTMAENAVSTLTSAGFPIADVSVLVPETLGTREMGTEKATKAPEGTAAGAGSGAVIGGKFLGLLAGIGAFGYPGRRPFDRSRTTRLRAQQA